MGYYQDKEFITKVGILLRKLRESKGIGQEELSLEAGLQPSQVGRTERAIINTSISHIAAYARILGVHPKELLDVAFDYDPNNPEKIKKHRSKK